MYLLTVAWNYRLVYAAFFSAHIFSNQPNRSTANKQLAAFNQLKRGKEALSREAELSLKSKAVRNNWLVLDNYAIISAQRKPYQSRKLEIT